MDAGSGEGLFESDAGVVFDVGTFPDERRMRLVADYEDDVRGDLIRVLIALFLERDARSGFPSGFNVHRQVFVLLVDAPVDADYLSGYFHFFRAPGHDLVESYVQVVLDGRILPLLLPRRVREVERLAAERIMPGASKRTDLAVRIVLPEEHPRPTAAEIEKRLERTRRSEELRKRRPRVSVESVREVLPRCSARNAPLQALLAVQVVNVSFLLVGKYLVRFGHFFKLLLRSGCLVLVRMVLHRKLAVRFLDIVIRCVLLNAERLIIVFPHIGSLVRIAIRMKTTLRFATFVLDGNF